MTNYENNNLGKRIFWGAVAAGALAYPVMKAADSVEAAAQKALNSRTAVEAPANPGVEQYTPKTYALLVEGRGPANPENVSIQNYDHSVEGLVSFYKMMINQGVPVSNIKFLIDRPSGMIIPGLNGLEKGVLGDSTKEEVIGFLDKLRNTNPQDKVYLIFSEPTPRPGRGTYSPWYGDAFSFYTNNPLEISSNINAIGLASNLQLIPASKVIISQDYGERSLLPAMGTTALIPPENTLAISSSNYDTPENNRFLMNFAEIYNRDKNQPISEIFQKLVEKEKYQTIAGPQAYYFTKEGRMIPAGLYQGFSAPLFPTKD